MSREQEGVHEEVKSDKKGINKCAWSLMDMMERVGKEPQLVMQYPGIKEKSVGIIFGPPKSAKTIFCENLGMSIAAGMNDYLGLPINVANKLVLFISFEEHYSNRTERNSNQVQALSIDIGDEWLRNYIVVDEQMPRYIITNEHWQGLCDLINSVKPGMVFLDSITRMYEGNIEDSKVAVYLTKKLRNLSEETGATIIAIHHTHKMYGQPISMDTIAGSRVIAQEMDFMIGLNRTLDGKRYIKNVAFRYSPCDSETVRTFKISDSCWLDVTGTTDEMKLLSALDGRKDDVNKKRILELLTEYKESGTTITLTADLEKKFVPQIMSKQTLFTNLKNLEKEGIIIKPEKGKYSLAA